MTSIQPIGKAYKFKTKSDDDVIIGDAAESTFKPKITLSRWVNECLLNISFDDSKIAEKNVKLADNKVQWETSNFDFILYPQEKDELGGLEFEIVLKSKPAINKIFFQIEIQNLKFLFQPPLTEWEKANGFMRPENVVGSYAVYHATRTNIHSNPSDAEKYRCGKAFHIYRPQLKDANGETAWADLKIDETEGTLTITLPQDFLDKATYPVTVDPTFGYTTKGASSWASSNNMSATRFPSGGAGTGIGITLFVQKVAWGTCKIKCAMYDGNNLVTNGTTLEHSFAADEYINDWDSSYTFPTAPTIADQDYRLVFWMNSNNPDFYYDSSGTNQWSNQNQTYDGWPDPANFGSESAYKFSIYCTYTSGGTLKEVADSIGLSDTLLRNKTLGVSDSLGLADSLLRDKSLTIADAIAATEIVAVAKLMTVTDQINLADAVSTPNRFLQALDLIGVLDNAYVNRVLVVSDQIALAETVEKMVGGAVKTRIFLLIGDLAVQLSG
jgi:hypothetical protein